MASGPLGGDLPGELELASYRHQQLRLSNHRIRYHGRGVRRHERASIRLDHITSVGLQRRLAIHPAVVAWPFALLAFGLVASLAVGSKEPLLGTLIAALATTPFALVANLFFGAALAIRISTPGHTLLVRVPRRHVSDAHGFVDRIEAERAQAAGIKGAGDVLGPTARPFGAARGPVHPQP